MGQKWASIVFVQGDEGYELTDKLYNIEGVMAHGATAESIKEMFEYLKQWDYGDTEVEVNDVPPWGPFDDVWVEDDYYLSANMGMGYVGLVLKIT